MIKFELNINDNITLFWDNKLFTTKVQDIRDDALYVYLPMKDGKYLISRKGEELNMEVYHDEYNNFAFKCETIDRVIENNIRLIKLTMPYDIERIQRRDYVRVSYIQEIKYVKDSEEADYRNALLINLSGGGVCFKTTDILNIGEIIDIRLTYSNEVAITKGKVVRGQIDEFGKHSYGVQFIDIDDITREKIIQFVFKLMRK